MSGIKGKSGRKPRHIEESKILDGLYPEAISVVKEILMNTQTAPNTRLEAALAVIYKKTGKPRQEIDQRVTGVIGLINADGIAERIKGRRLEEARLIAEYSQVSQDTIVKEVSNALTGTSQEGLSEGPDEEEEV